MKKLGKLSINPEKVIKNEELANLRGGYLDELCQGLNCSFPNQDYYCQCVGSVGAWCTCASSEWAAETAGASNCSSGSVDCAHYIFV